MASETKDATGIPEDFDLLAFVETGTVATREVVIYTDHEAARRCMEIEAELDKIEADDDGEERALGESSDEERRAELESDGKRWSDRLKKSKMTWTVRAISHDEIKAAFDAVPPPKMPIPPKDGAAKAVHDKWAEKVGEYSKAEATAKEDRELFMIATAVVGIETPAGSTDSVTVDQLKALRSKPHGQGWINKLYAAMDEASSADAEPPVPTSPGRSTSTRG